MNEVARLQMLDAIGIAPLVPRFVLPGALPSPQCDTEGLDVVTALGPQYASITAPAAAVTATHTPASRVEPRVARPQAPRFDTDVLAEPLQQQSARASTSAAKSDARSDATPRLQVNLIQHHTRCFSLLPVYKPEFQAEADQFLRAVMLSLGVASAPLATQAFRWPFANNAKLDLGPAALREALGGFIQHAAREADSVILVWGLDLARYLGDEALRQPGEFALSPALRAIATHRVQDYFNEPLRKRELWQQICALKSVFKTGVA